MPEMTEDDYEAYAKRNGHCCWAGMTAAPEPCPWHSEDEFGRIARDSFMDHQVYMAQHANELERMAQKVRARQMAFSKVWDDAIAPVIEVGLPQAADEAVETDGRPEKSGP